MDFQNQESPRPPRGMGPLLPAGLVFVAFFTLILALSLVPGDLFAQGVPAPRPRTSATSEQSELLALQQVLSFIMSNYVDEVDRQKLIEGAYKGMFEALEDPYSVYLGASDQREITDTTSGEFGGIGAYIEKQRNPDGSPRPDGYIEIAAPIEDTPAFRADLRSGDLILSIDEKPTADMTIDEAVNNLRGPARTKVNLLIQRGRGEPFTVAITRQVIQVPNYKKAMIGNNAYIRLIQFTPKTAENFATAFEELQKNNPQALIIDLRNNPGGVLDSPLEIADLFFDDGPLLSTQGRMSGENQVFEAQRGVLVPRELPVFVLVNGGSASASEILAGALKDRGRAVVVGETTFGKGLVQRVIPLTANTGFKLTTSRYYTPSGVTIDKVGVAPTVEFKEPELVEAEEKSLLAIRDQLLVEAFLDRTPKPTDREIEAFGKELEGKGIVVPARYVRRLVRLELERRNNTQAVYDLDFDLTLQEAIRLVPQWPSLRPPVRIGTPGAPRKP